MALKSINVTLYPNAHMRNYIQSQCDYRRYCWNQGLGLWNDLYDMYRLNKQSNKKPNEYQVRNELVKLKNDWELKQSSRVLQNAMRDLNKAFKMFFDGHYPQFDHPKFYSKKRTKQSFKTDRVKIVNNKLRLDKPHMIDKTTFYDIRMRGNIEFTGKLKLVNVKIVNNKYIATLFYETDESQVSVYTNQKTAIDINVGHINYTDGKLNTLPTKIERLYDQNNHYQHLLTCKRNVNSTNFRKSNQYQVVRNKLQRNYRKITAYQNDLYHKFTNYLVNHYDEIVIEDLKVNQMQMTHVTSKGMQRSSFAKFRQLLTYKCQWHGKHLIIADQYYPSTQLCSKCGYRKNKDDRITLSGNKKHNTKHEQYICYNCGFIGNRDKNAVVNLLKLAN
ncbi:RNA-guided endonuclease InsQ/TnpB family protein [Lactobacillaceae bacterium Melli_B3]